MAKTKSAGGKTAEGAQTQAERRYESVEVSETGPCKRRLKIVVGAPRVKHRMEERFTELARSAALPGFRAGRAPRALVEKRFEKDVAEETKLGLMGDALEAALEDKSLTPLGDAEPVEESVSFGTDQGLTFETDVVVRPDITLKPYDKIPVERPSVDVSDADVDAAIDEMRAEHAPWVPLPAGEAPGEKDLRVGSATFSADGQELWRDAVEVLPSAAGVGPCLVQDLAKRLAGAGAGATIEAPATIHPDVEDETLHGRTGTLRFQIEEVKRAQPPALDDAFARQQRCGSVAELRAKVNDHLRRARERDADLAMRRQVRTWLVEQHPFDLPESYVEAEANNQLRNAWLRLRMRGVPPKEIERHLETMQRASRESAVAGLRGLFLLEEIAKREKVFATEEQVEERMRAIADREGISVERVRSRLDRAGDLGQLRMEIRHEAVEDLLLQRSTGAPSPRASRRAQEAAARPAGAPEGKPERAPRARKGKP